MIKRKYFVATQLNLKKEITYSWTIVNHKSFFPESVLALNSAMGIISKRLDCKSEDLAITSFNRC